MESENKNVIHPTHYNRSERKECWDEMIELFGEDAVIIFDVLNAYKYYYRKGFKDCNSCEQDAGKMENYMNHARNLMLLKIGEEDVKSSRTYLIMQNILEESEV